MNKELRKKLIEEIERKEGVEQPVQMMMFSFDNLIHYINFYENELEKQIKIILNS